MKYFVVPVALSLASIPPAFPQGAPTGEAPFERLHRMISEQPCSKAIARLDEEYARGGMPSIEDRGAFRQASKERVAEYGATWGLLIGYDENGRLSEEANKIIEQLRSLCTEDPDAKLEHLIDSLE